MLQDLVDKKEIVRHWLEPTKRAPKVYSEVSEEGWLECLLRITSVGNVVPIVQSDDLCQKLWGNKGENTVQTNFLCKASNFVGS